LGKLINITLVSTSVSILFIFFIGILILWNTTRPLKKLKDAIGLYEPYRKASVFPKADSTEIGELIETFQIMSERINKHHNNQIEFLQNVSHELRTPLMSIQGYSMAIKDQVVTVDQGLHVITKESQRLIEMVERLLQLSRLETVEEGWTESIVDLNNMAEQAIELLAPVANERNIQLSVEGISLEAYLPAEEIFQVIVNLLQNAIKYAKSEVILRIEGALSEDFLTDAWAIHIDDDGAGLTEEQRKFVFQRFYKGENGGTGLGLAICQQIADRLGAHLECTVSEMGGARFSFSFRVATDLLDYAN
jgi:signal transduction histidine kinase